MSDKPNTQDKQATNEQPLTWEAIGKLSKQEYMARRDEIQAWMKKNISSSSGRVISR